MDLPGPRWKKGKDGKGFAALAAANPMSSIVAELQASLRDSEAVAILAAHARDAILESGGLGNLLSTDTTGGLEHIEQMRNLRGRSPLVRAPGMASGSSTLVRKIGVLQKINKTKQNHTPAVELISVEKQEELVHRVSLPNPCSNAHGFREKVGRRAKAQGAHRVFALLATTKCSAACHSSARVPSCSVTRNAKNLYQHRRQEATLFTLFGLEW